MSDDTQNIQELSLFELFRMEAEERCSVLSETLLQVDARQEQPVLLEELMRAAHSLKGAARIVNLSEAVSIAHCMEDVFVAAQRGESIISDSWTDILLQGVDYLLNFARRSDLDRCSNQQEMSQEGRALLDLLEPLLRKSSSASHPVDQQSPVVKQPQPPSLLTETAISTPATITVASESMERLLGLASEARIASRWLPSFARDLLQLKKQQDSMARYLETTRDFLVLEHKTINNDIFAGLQKQLTSCQNLLAGFLDTAEDQGSKAADIAHRLHQEVLASKMVPFTTGTRGLARLVRDLSKELGKKVRLEISGKETMVDREILGELENPIRHLIRNCIDHGLESPAERQDTGKHPTGKLTVRAFHQSGMLHLEVADDGRGIDPEQIRKMVVERGMASEDLSISFSHQELYSFLFLPSFSTRQQVSEISGRGVGLDVVYDAIRRLRGTITVDAQVNQGARFIMQLPLTLSVVRALLVSINAEAYALPAVQIERVLTIDRQVIQHIEGRPYCTVQKQRIGLVSARSLFAFPEATSPSDRLSVIVLRNQDNYYGLLVDSFTGIRDLIVQALDARLGSVNDINSTAVLEDGTPVLVIDTEDIVRSMDALISAPPQANHEAQTADHPTLQTILVVDDSITVREVEREMLLAQGYNVEVAVDGQDAWRRIRKGGLNLVVTDIDMPRMDGFALTRAIKNDPRQYTLPVIIVSYKDRQEDKAAGLEAGADYYLTKSGFEDETLVEAVRELIGSPGDS